MKLKNAFALAWLSIISAFYFKNHNYYYSWALNFWKPLILVMLTIGLIYFAVSGWQKLKGDKTLLVRPITIILFVVTIFWSMGIVSYALRDVAYFPNSQYKLATMTGDRLIMAEIDYESPEIEKVLFWPGDIVNQWTESKEVLPQEIQDFFVTKGVFSFGLELMKNSVVVMSGWAFFIILFYGLGSFFARGKSDNLLHYFHATGVGMALCMGIVFVLGTMGQLSTKSVWIVIGPLAFVALWKSKDLIRALWNEKIKVVAKDFRRNSIIYLGTLFFIAVNFLEILIPNPSGFDSLTRYHNTSLLLTQYESLIGGIPAYNYELIISLGLLLFKNKMIALSLILGGAFLGFGLLYYLLKKSLGSQKAGWMTLLFMSLPMVNYMISTDLKIDIPLLYFNLLAIFFVVQWHKSRQKKDLLWSSFFLGISFGIKYTSLFLISTVLAFLSYEIIGWLGAIGITMVFIGGMILVNRVLPLDGLSGGGVLFIGIIISIVGMLSIVAGAVCKNKFKYLINIVGTACFVIVLVFTPWLVKNSGTSDILKGESYEMSQMPGKGNCASASLYSEKNDFQGRYEGNKLLLPIVYLWESTLNSGEQNNRLIDIGFLFLGLLGVGMMSINKAIQRDKNLQNIIVFTGIYTLLWATMGNGIVWYGLTGFIGILYIYGSILNEKKWIKVVIGLWICAAILLRFGVFFTGNNMLYGGGLIDEATYLEQRYTGVNEFMALVNSEEGSEKNLIIMDNFYLYFVEKNDQRVYRDSDLTMFNCSLSDENPSVILNRLNNLNIGYILFKDDALDQKENRENQELIKIFNEFDEFAEQYLEKVFYRKDVIIYRVLH